MVNIIAQTIRTEIIVESEVRRRLIYMIYLKSRDVEFA
jgi:hypothetical protein